MRVIRLVPWFVVLILLAQTGMAFGQSPFADQTVVPGKMVSTTDAAGGAKPPAGSLGSATAGLKVRVAAYNIAHGRGLLTGGLNELAKMKNLRSIANLLKTQKVDLVGFTEISQGDLRAKFRDQPEYFAKALGFHVVYAENVERFFGLLATQGNALVSRFPILSSKNHKLSKTDPKNEQRSCLETLLDLGKGNRLRVFVTHLSTKKEESTAQVRELWKMIEGSAEPVILMGDFNLRPGHEPIKWLSKLMTDASANLATSHSGGPEVKIDYHFTYGRIKAGTSWVAGLEEKYSDHACVLNDYVVGNR